MAPYFPLKIQLNLTLFYKIRQYKSRKIHKNHTSKLKKKYTKISSKIKTPEYINIVQAK